MAVTMRTRVGNVRNTHAAEPDPGVEPLHETVALRQRQQRIDDLTIHQPKVSGISGHLEAAVGIDQRIEPTRTVPLEPAFVASAHPARIDNVVAFLPAPNEGGNQGRRVLQVRIHHHDDVTRAGLQAGGQCGFLPEVPRQLNHPESRNPGPFRHDRRRRIRAAIVDHDDLPGGAAVGQRHAEQRQKPVQVLRFIAARNDA